MSIDELIKILQCCNRPDDFRHMEEELIAIEERKLTDEKKDGLQNFINNMIFQKSELLFNPAVRSFFEFSMGESNQPQMSIQTRPQMQRRQIVEEE